MRQVQVKLENDMKMDPSEFSSMTESELLRFQKQKELKSLRQQVDKIVSKDLAKAIERLSELDNSDVVMVGVIYIVTIK